MAQTRAFAIIGHSLWNQLLPSTRSTLLTGEPIVPLFVPSRLLSSLWVSHTGIASDWCALQEALYKCIDTIQYAFMEICKFYSGKKALVFYATPVYANVSLVDCCVQ